MMNASTTRSYTPFNAIQHTMPCPGLLRLDSIAQSTAREPAPTTSTTKCTPAPVASPTTAAAATSTATALPLERIVRARCPLLQYPLVGLDEVLRLISERERQALQSAKLDALAEDDGAVDLVECRGKLFVVNHLADERGDLGLGQVEHAG